jgi:hypothetical protein
MKTALVRLLAALLLIGCIAWLWFSATAHAAPRVCSDPCVLAFAQGCYEGTGAPQTIVDEIAEHALVFTYNVSPGTDTPLGVYRSSAMGTDSDNVSARPISATLAADRITSWTDGSFDVGADDGVNRNGDPYCWFSWGRSRLTGTFMYLGDTAISTPRTITIPGLTGDADFAAVQLPDDALSFRRGKIYMRTDAMPTNVSYGWHNVAETPPTTLIRDLTAASIVVGDDLNENGRVYRGFWFKRDSSFGQPFTWTGNGDDGFQCADAADIQTVDPMCQPINVITVGCGGSHSICEHSCQAAGHGGVLPIIRGTNMGTSVVGPGHTTNDFTTIYATGRLSSCLGNFTATTFDVTGAGSFNSNLNDIGITPFAWVTCAPACVHNP